MNNISIKIMISGFAINIFSLIVAILGMSIATYINIF